MGTGVAVKAFKPLAKALIVLFVVESSSCVGDFDNSSLAVIFGKRAGGARPNTAKISGINACVKRFSSYNIGSRTGIGHCTNSLFVEFS